MTLFFILAAILLVSSSAFLILPMMRAPKTPPEAQRETALSILKEQLAELEKDHQEGRIPPEDFQEAKNEIKRRILDEAKETGTPVATSPLGLKTGIALVFILFISSAIGYLFLGNPLATHLEAHPEDEESWIILGQKYQEAGYTANATRAFSHAEKQMLLDPELSLNYINLLAAENGGNFRGKAGQIALAALEKNPEDSQLLLFAGMAAYENGDRESAANHWEKVLPRIEENSELYKTLKGKITQIRAENTRNPPPSRKKSKPITPR